MMELRSGEISHCKRVGFMIQMKLFLSPWFVLSRWQIQAELHQMVFFSARKHKVLVQRCRNQGSDIHLSAARQARIIRVLFVFRPDCHQPSSDLSLSLSLCNIIRSHLFDKLPGIYNSLEGVAVDFFNKVLCSQGAYCDILYSKMHGLMRRERLSVTLDLIKVNLQ